MIADASVLIVYARAGRLGVLKTLFHAVEVPAAVRSEVFARGPASPDVRAIEAAFREKWMGPAAVHGKRIGAMAERFPNLGLGELACLALAVQAGEREVLLDDVPARKAAQMIGLRPIGCLGILARAHAAGILATKDDVATALRGLLAAGLWVDAEVVEAFWLRLGGRP